MAFSTSTAGSKIGVLKRLLSSCLEAVEGVVSPNATSYYRSSKPEGSLSAPPPIIFAFALYFLPWPKSLIVSRSSNSSLRPNILHNTFLSTLTNSFISLLVSDIQS